MTNEELTMLRCMVEYIEQISGNDYVYGKSSKIHGETVYDSVSLESCRRWLESEQYRRAAQ
jgi:hypothetical protein